MHKVTFFLRRRGQGAFSIEQLFFDIPKYLPKNFQCNFHTSKYESNGFFKRLYNMLEAIFNQSSVNHILGDVHFLVLFMKKRKTILTIHDCIMMHRLQGIKKFLYWLFWLWLPVRRVQIITVVSESTRNELIKYTNINSSHIVVIPNGISDLFVPYPKSFNAILPKILQIGTTPNKNIIKLANALVGIPCELTIVGYLSLDDEMVLVKSGINYRNIYELTELEIFEEYVSCDLVAFISTYEGFGMPIIEANAVGRPVITSNMWSMPEVANDSACLVDPFDVDSIRLGFLKVIHEPDYRQHLINRGYLNAKRFTKSKMAREYLSTYNRILELG